jgi:hypothetical protein
LALSSFALSSAFGYGAFALSVLSAFGKSLDFDFETGATG